MQSHGKFRSFYRNMIQKTAKLKKARIVPRFSSNRPRSRQWSTKNTMWDLMKDDKADEFDKLLGRLDEEKKGALLNGKWIKPQAEDLKPKNIKEKLTKQFKSFFERNQRNRGLQDDSRPLFQSLIFGSFCVFRALLNHGADLFQTAENGWNIVHYLIVVSHENNKYEQKAVSIYKQLLSELTESDVRTLLAMEDKQGLRPLELAMHASCLQLFNAIMNTPGVYLVNIQRKGLQEVSWYDVTEYENFTYCKPSRCDKSPIEIMTYLDRKVFKSEEAIAILRKGMLKKWADKKFHVNAGFVWIWFLLRLVSVVAFFLMLTTDMKTFLHQVYFLTISMFTIDCENTNSTSECGDVFLNKSVGSSVNGVNNETENLEANTTELSCAPFQGWYISTRSITSNLGYFLALLMNYMYLTLFMTFSLLYDVVSVLQYILLTVLGCRNWYRWQTQTKDVIISTTFYRICQMFFTVSALGFLSFHTLALMHLIQLDSVTTTLKYMILNTCFYSMWSILYFVQIMPSVGHFVNSIRRLLGIMANFIIVYLLMFFPYPHGFLLLIKDTSNCDVPDFENFVDGVYSSFKIMLNMVDLSQYAPGDQTQTICSSCKQKKEQVSAKVELCTTSSTPISFSGDQFPFIQALRTYS